MAITSSPPVRWRRVDVSSADYDFMASRGERGRAIRVITPSGTSNPQITFREKDENADLTMNLAAGQIEVIPGDFTHIRRAGTTSTLVIYDAV